MSLLLLGWPAVRPDSVLPGSNKVKVVGLMISEEGGRNTVGLQFNDKLEGIHEFKAHYSTKDVTPGDVSVLGSSATQLCHRWARRPQSLGLMRTLSCSRRLVVVALQVEQEYEG